MNIDEIFTTYNTAILIEIRPYTIYNNKARVISTIIQRQTTRSYNCSYQIKQNKKKHFWTTSTKNLFCKNFFFFTSLNNMSIYKWRFSIYQRNFWTSTASNYQRKKKLLKRVNISPLFKHVDILARIRRTNIIKRKIIRQRRRQTTKSQYSIHLSYIPLHEVIPRPPKLYDLLLNLISIRFPCMSAVHSFSCLLWWCL